MATQQPRRGNRGNRAQQQYPQPPPQDPATEYPFALSEDGRPDDFITAANLKVLRRHHPDVDSIVFLAHIAHLYKYDPETGGYGEMLANGPTFIVSLTSTDPDIPRYAIILMNRKNLDVFRIDFEPEDDIEMGETHIFVRNREKADSIWCLSIHRGPDEESAMRQDPEKAQAAITDAVKKMEEGTKVAEARKAATASASQGQWAHISVDGYRAPVQHDMGFQQQREPSTAAGMQHPYNYPPPAAPSPYPPAQNQQPHPHAFGPPQPYQNMPMQQQQQHFQPAFPPPAPSQTQTPNIDINQLFASVQSQGSAQGYNGMR